MRTYYQVRTGWDLPPSKVCFDCQCQMESHVKWILKMNKKLTNEQRIRSINVIRMETENRNEFDDIFKRND
jgi:hypothetical protein